MCWFETLQVYIINNLHLPHLDLKNTHMTYCLIPYACILLYRNINGASPRGNQQPQPSLHSHMNARKHLTVGMRYVWCLLTWSISKAFDTVDQELLNQQNPVRCIRRSSIFPSTCDIWRPTRVSAWATALFNGVSAAISGSNITDNIALYKSIRKNTPCYRGTLLQFAAG